MRLVVYAEGPGELGDTSALAPGSPIPESALGPGHRLVQRALEGVGVQFIVGLHAFGRRPRGTLLLHRRSLIELLTWPSPARTPDLVVLLVDRDGDETRRSSLQRTLGERRLPHPPVVVGVAHEEFESWLIADPAATQLVLGAPVETPRAPDNLGPRAAKAMLNAWIDEQGADGLASRCAIAERMDLNVACRRSSSLSAFVADLRRVMLAG